MKECLKCKADISERHEKAKFCSNSCRVMWNRKNKGIVKSVQISVLHNEAMEALAEMKKIQSQISFDLLMFGQARKDGKPLVEGITPDTKFSVEPVKRMALKRTPAHWVELRRDCQTADDYAKWLEDLEADTFLTIREKAQIKQTV
jgi:hypothetical protein